MHYPFVECIRSLLGFCDEVVVADAGSSDGTLDVLRNLQRENPALKVFVEPVDFSHPRWAIYQDGYLKAKARAHCSGDYCWQADTDEIVAQEDFARIRQLTQVVGDTKLLMLPMIEFWGSLDKVRADFFPWKPRFSVNDKRITHGIPNRHKLFDASGHPYPRPFDSDTCNYIYRDTGEDVKIVIPISGSLEEVGRLDQEAFESFFYECLDELPAVFHVSWLDLSRKIRHYQKFWKRFHASMYNLDLADTAEGNVMFEKPWCEVSENEIALKAEELKRLGPRSFHKKLDPAHVGARFNFKRKIPESLLAWARKEASASPQNGATAIIEDQHISIMQYPLVSAIIPSYNKAKYLRESVGSMIAQDYPHLEILVVNDGSQDETSEVARTLAREYPARRIKLIEKSNGGISDARNFGVRQSQGRYLVTLDGDDMALETFVGKGMSVLLGEKANVFCSDVELFGLKTGDWCPNAYDHYSIRYANSIPSLALFEKDLWTKAGGYKVALAFVEDWDFWISCSKYDLKVIKCDKKLFRYRMISDGLAEAHINNRHRDCQSVVTIANPELYPVDEVLMAHANMAEVPAATVEKIKALDKIHQREWLLKFWLGLFAEKEGRAQDAAVLYGTALALCDCKNWQAALRVGSLLLSTGNHRDGVEFLQLVRIHRPDMAKMVNPTMKEIEREILSKAPPP